jgi:ankyrin repeat protein
MALSILACGKKAKEEKLSLDKTAQNTETQLAEETHKELVAAIESNNLVEFKRLLDLKSQVDLNKILPDGETLLTKTVVYNRLQMLELLIDNSASLFKTNARKETALMVGAKLGFEDIVKFLISLGAKTDNKDENGNTSLHLAVLGKFESLAIYLINCNTNIEITNNKDQTALRIAELLDLKKVVNLLRSLTQSSVGLPEKNAVRNMLILGDVENLNKLFINYPTIVYEYKDINYYVLVIRSHPHDKALSMTHLLMQYGVNLNGPREADSTPLIEAVRRNYDDFITMMLKENVNPNGVDDKGNSPLAWAVQQNNLNLVEKLLDKNAMVKYSYTLNGKKKTMNTCSIARDIRKKLTSSEDKKINEDILDALGCGLRWLF